MTSAQLVMFGKAYLTLAGKKMTIEAQVDVMCVLDALGSARQMLSVRSMHNDMRM